MNHELRSLDVRLEWRGSIARRASLFVCAHRIEDAAILRID
jgi:hypothetical protein